MQSPWGYSLEEQQEAIRRYCELNGIELIDIYIDVGISGRKVYRPQFNLMLDAIRRNSYDVVVVWRLDRATRKPSLGYKLKDALDATQTEIVSLTEGYIQNRFMYAIALAMAEEESEKRSERAKIGSAGRAKKGKVMGVVKYGYKVGEDGMPQINEPEAVVVRRIFNEYTSGLRVGQIADGLNDDGIPTKFGNTWDGVAVSRLIASSQYAGHTYAMRQYKQLIDNGERDMIHTYWRDKSEWIRQEYPAIVGPQTWERAQEIKAVSRGLRAKKGYKVNFLLRHLVWCESCGCRFHPMSFYHKTRRK